METQPVQPIKKYKTFSYATNAEWISDRQGVVRAHGKPDIQVSSPPEFKGVPDVWTPEDFLVSAVEQCTLTTFLAFGLRKGIPLKSYRSNAEGLLENTDGKYRFTTIKILPVITVESSWTKEQVEEIVHQAHDNCLIANSLTAEVSIEPTIIIE